MPQCKRDGCREQAQPFGKRLCPKHEAERKARSAAYFSKPKCVFCGTQHTDRKDGLNRPECMTCYNERLERERAQDVERLKYDALDACRDTEDLKQWIRYYVLNAPLQL